MKKSPDLVSLDPTIGHVIVLDHVVCRQIFLQEPSCILDVLPRLDGVIVGIQLLCSVEMTLCICNLRVIVTILLNHL